MKNLQLMLLGIVLAIAGCFFAVLSLLSIDPTGIMTLISIILGGILLLAGIALCVVGYKKNHEDK